MNIQVQDSIGCFTIYTFDDLIDSLGYLYDKYNEKLWFRGQKDSSWKLVPSIQRYNLSDEDERHLSHDFRILASQIMENAPSRKDFAAWMANMQHYGMPTRMLDWTKSPLIAAYFALEDKSNDTDSCIWVLRPSFLNRIEVDDPSLFEIDSGTAERMLEPAFYPDYNSDDQLREKVKDKILACYSIQNNLRMYSQQSCFTIHNTKRLLTHISEPDLLFKFIIPREAQPYFRYVLKAFSITRGAIFPDLDNISADLRSQYSIV